MDITVATHSDRGKVREENEDSVLASPPLIAVADGMGGHEGGEVASQLALDTLLTWKERLDGKSGRDASETLKEAFGDANRAVSQKGSEDSALQGMGTTLTAGWISNGSLMLAHVGDSRAYLLRNGQLQQLSEDQTVAQEWVRRGRLSEAEAATSPHRHILLQAIGAETDRLDIDTTSVALRPGDRLLFASDGLYGMLTDNTRIREILVDNSDPHVAARALVDAANDAGGEDNISVVIADISGDDSEFPEETEGAPVIIERGDAAEVKTVAKEPRIPRIWLVGIGAAVLLAAMVIGLLLRSTDTLLVASNRDRVVVLKGHLGSDDEPARGKVVYVFEGKHPEDFPTTVQRNLEQGIPVDSIAEAKQVIHQQPRVKAPLESPTPKPTPSPSGTPKPTPTKTP